MKKFSNSSILGLAVAVFSFTACSHPTQQSARDPSSERNWQFDYARYVLYDVVNAKTGASVLERDGMMGDTPGQRGYSECRIDFAQRDVTMGTLTIYQYSDDTYIRSFRTITIPKIQAKVELTGFNGQCHAFRKNSSWAIRNLSGKTVADIFASKYSGQKLGVSVGAHLAVNVNEALMRNKAGVVITNVEQMLGIFDTGSVGLGLVLAWNTITFDQSNLNSKNDEVTITNMKEDGTTQTKSTSSLDDALKITL